MCSKGGGSPPVPSAASTTFNSTTAPSAFATPLYQDFLNRANALSNTPFNTAQLGQVAPLNAQQTQAGNQLFDLGMHMGDFDPAKIREIESPYTEDVVNATQNWFNNNNAIQGNDLLSQAIRSGNAFGGDRAGAGEAILAGQQQLAQAPVIAGLRQAGYTQALDEYNRLKTMGLQGAGAALGWGSMEQAQQQKEFDVAQQNAMMQSAYPFQTLNWYGSLLGGIAPLLGQTAFGSNNPPEQSGLAAGLGAASAGIGLASSLVGGSGPQGGKYGGAIHRRARGGLVPVFVRHNGGIVAGLAYGGETDSDDDRDQTTRYSSPDIYRDSSSEGGAETSAPPRQENATSSPYYTPPPRKATRSDLGLDPANIRALGPQPVQPPSGGSTQQSGQPSTSDWLKFGTTVGSGLAKLAPLLLVKRGGVIRHYQDGGGDDDDQLTMTDLGVLDPQGRPLSPGIAGRERGSPGANEAGLREVGNTGRFSPVQQAEDMPNLARIRERFKPALEGNEALRRKFDVNTTAEVGTDQARRDAYQASVLDRAAYRGESLPYTLSRGPGTPDRYYPGTTANARAASGQGVSPSLWGGANPANFGTGNASRDPVTGRDVGFGGGPQTASTGAERYGIEGIDLAGARRAGYRGPSTTAIGFGAGAPQGTYGGDATARQMAQTQYPEGTREKVGVSPEEEQRRQGRAGGPEAGAGTGAVGTRIPGIPEKSFAQRLAGNPFWQFGTALMAKPGIKGRELSAFGGAAQSMSAQQLAQRKEDILENKPEMIHTDKGIMFRYPNGDIVPTGLKSESLAREEFDRKTQKPFTVKSEQEGLFGPKTVEKSYRYDENGNLVPVEVTPQQQGAPAGQPQRVVPPPAPQQQPPAPQQPAPQVRQTQAQPAEPPPPPDAFGASGWARSPTTGNYHNREGEIRDPSGKVLSPAPTQTAGQQQQGTGAAGGPLTPPDKGADPQLWSQVAQAWQSGQVQPGGGVTTPGARNEDFLATLKPQAQRIVKDMVDYKLDPNKHFPGVKNAEDKRLAIDAAKQYDPSYEAASFANKQATRKAYEATGVEARNFQSNDMAIQHLGRAMDNVEGLNNIGGRFGTNWVNDLRTKIKTEIPGLVDQEYKARLAQMKVDLGAVSTELSKSFRGVGALSQREVQDWQHKMNVAASPEEMRAVLKEGAILLAGRLDANAHRYNETMGPAYARTADSWLSSKAQTTLRRAFAIDPMKPIPPLGQ